MLSRGVGYMIKKKGIEYIFDGYNPLSHAPRNSWVLLNLESPFTIPDKDTAERTFSFGANVNNVAILQWLADERPLIVSLANNHIMNGGIPGFHTTIETLDRAGIAHV